MFLLLPYLILAATALAAGIQNSLAGGGTLYTFPALEYYVGPVHANATSTVALVTGSIAGAWGFRSELQHSRKWLWWLVPPCIIGGVIGTWLVMVFPEAVFKALVPWLILTAATLFLLQPLISRWVGAGQPHAEPPLRVKIGVVLFQFIVAIYGGYFGAGIGILMISSLSLMGLGDIHKVNALKALLAACINIVSVFMWVGGGLVTWKFVPVMAAAAIAGGYFGARVSRRMNKTLLRWLIIAVGFGLSGYYFARQLHLI
jgi:uncharacterized membrane protein YfcA